MLFHFKCHFTDILHLPPPPLFFSSRNWRCPHSCPTPTQQLRKLTPHKLKCISYRCISAYTRDPTALHMYTTSRTSRVQRLLPLAHACVYSVSCGWCTHIDQARVVSLSQVVQHRRFIEAGEVGHVLHFAEARRVHTLHLLPGQGHPPLAVCQLHLHLITALLSDAGRLDLIEKHWGVFTS